MKTLSNIFLTACALLLCACGDQAQHDPSAADNGPTDTYHSLQTSDNGRRMHIGVSQCSGGDWRNKMNDEMRREAIFHEDITFDFCCANDDVAKQRHDVDSLINAGADLLVIAPIDSVHGQQLVTDVLRRGIPVIVADRRLPGTDYTAFVGGDNYMAGYNAGEYLATMLPEGGQLLEIRGHDGSSPVTQRQQGFMDAIRQNPALQVVRTVDGWWLRDSAKVVMEDAIHAYPELRGVFCHNDYMAMGAFEMYHWVRQCQRDYGDTVPDWDPVFVGIDAVYGPNHGLAWVARGDLDASVLYPTGGDVIVQTAVRVLSGQPYERDIILPTFVVSQRNAALLNDMDQAVMHEVDKVNWLQQRQLTLLRQINVGHWLLGVSCLFILFIIIAMLQMRRHYLERRRAALLLVRANRQLRDAAQCQLEELRRQHAAPVTADGAPSAADPEPASTSRGANNTAPAIDPFIEQVYRQIDAHYHEQDFGVEFLSVLLNMSRSQLYRRVKTLTGMTPFDMIREKRQFEATQLLAQGVSIDEVARRVGYSSTVYFVKCFEEYKRLDNER